MPNRKLIIQGMPKTMEADIGGNESQNKCLAGLVTLETVDL